MGADLGEGFVEVSVGEERQDGAEDLLAPRRVPVGPRPGHGGAEMEPFRIALAAPEQGEAGKEPLKAAEVGFRGRSGP